MLFHETGHFFNFFPEKFIEMPKHGSLFEKLQVLAKSMIFRAFSRNGTFGNFFLENSSKCKNIEVCSKSCKDLAKLMIFRAFSRHEQLFATFCCNVHRNVKTW